MTTSNSMDGINLERLETVGDSFLKLSATNYLYHNHVDQHEGKLSFARSKEVWFFEFKSCFLYQFLTTKFSWKSIFEFNICQNYPFPLFLTILLKFEPQWFIFWMTYISLFLEFHIKCYNFFNNWFFSNLVSWLIFELKIGS